MQRPLPRPAVPENECSAEVDGVIFDTDGVITQTAAVHFEAWKSVFDPVVERLGSGPDRRPFTDADYRHFVDGIARYDGVAALLASRSIALPWGDPTDSPGVDTVCGVGNTKNGAFLARLEADGVGPYLTTVSFIRRCREAGVRTAAISASRNCRSVLDAAGVAELFDVVVDGGDADSLGLAGKPAPDVFLEAARRIGVSPDRSAVFEDAEAGVQAARAGGFGLVIGIDRTGHAGPLAEHADLVVGDAADLDLDGRTVRRSVPRRARVTDLPSALGDRDLARRLDGRRVAVFLDYDGTLTPIVSRPEDALLAPETRAAIRELARHAVVGIISGRDLDDVRTMVDTPGTWFAGSHGFDVEAPSGQRHEFDVGRGTLPALDLAERELAATVDAFEGAWVDRKHFAIAVHYRASPPDVVPDLETAVAAAAASHPELRMTGGKMIFELRPEAEWNKGRALRWLMDAAGVDPVATVTLYVGDDDTDEDAFDALRDDGVGVVVGRDGRQTAARYRLERTDDVRAMLEALTNMVGGA